MDVQISRLKTTRLMLIAAAIRYSNHAKPSYCQFMDCVLSQHANRDGISKTVYYHVRLDLDLIPRFGLGIKNHTMYDENTFSFHSCHKLRWLIVS